MHLRQLTNFAIKSVSISFFDFEFSGLGGFGQQIGGFASPSTAFGGPKFGTGVGSGLGVGLGGLGGKTSPSGFNLGGGMGSGFGATSTQQIQPFGGTSAFGTGGGGFGAPQQQLQVQKRNLN